MTTPSFNYDEMSDTLYVSFAPGEAATDIELNDYILLRINRQERRAVGLTLFDYSVSPSPVEVILITLLQPVSSTTRTA